MNKGDIWLTGTLLLIFSCPNNRFCCNGPIFSH